MCFRLMTNTNTRMTTSCVIYTTNVFLSNNKFKHKNDDLCKRVKMREWEGVQERM